MITPDEPNITAASEAEFGDLGGFVRTMFPTFRVTRVTPDKQIPAPPEEDEGRSRCGCLVCSHPDKYRSDNHFARRVLHMARHLDLDEFMDRRDDARLRAMGVEPAPRDPADPSDEGPAPTGACHVHPGMPPHPAHR